MSDADTAPSAKALESLLARRERFDRLGEKDFAAATALLVKKLMVSAGQTTDDMKDLRDTVGPDLFETTLKRIEALGEFSGREDVDVPVGQPRRQPNVLTSLADGQRQLVLVDHHRGPSQFEAQ